MPLLPSDLVRWLIRRAGSECLFNRLQVQRPAKGVGSISLEALGIRQGQHLGLFLCPAGQALGVTLDVSVRTVGGGLATNPPKVMMSAHVAKSRHSHVLANWINQRLLATCPTISAGWVFAMSR